MIFPTFLLLLFLTVHPSSAKERIAYGQPVALNEIPHHAWISPYSPYHNDSYYCGGSLIHKRVVLTAAHCYTPGWNAQISLGGINTQLYAPYVGEIEPDAWTLHPRYNKTSGSTDLALIKLPFECNLQVAYLPLPPDKVRTGQIGTLAGYGQTDKLKISTILMKTQLRVLENSECENWDDNTNITMTEQKMCTTTHNNATQTGMCLGDSGGGFFVPHRRDPEKKSIIGVASYSIHNNLNCTEVRRTVFIRTKTFIRWLTETIDKIVNG